MKLLALSERCSRYRRWHWVAALALALGVPALQGCCASEEEIQEEFDDFLRGRDSCEVDEDCAIASSGCPLSCFEVVNQSHVTAVERKARDLIEEYEACGAACAYDCVDFEAVVCDSGRCSVTHQSD